MRKITKLSVQALYSFRNFKSGNDRVAVINGGTEATLYLHGNAIANLAKQADGTLDLEITTAGWNTPTTFSRLNGLPGVRINRKNWSVYLNDVGWDGEWITVGTPENGGHAHSPSPAPVAVAQDPDPVGLGALLSFYDIPSNIFAYESGELDHDRIIELFQHLVNSGTINHLQGSYGRTAHHLISEGLVTVGGAL